MEIPDQIQKTERAKELIQAGKVGFVEIPEGIDPKGIQDVIAITLDRRYAIVDCSRGNNTLSNVANSLGFAKYREDYYTLFQPGGVLLTHHNVSIVHHYGPKNVNDGPRNDFRRTDEKKSYEELASKYNFENIIVL